MANKIKFIINTAVEYFDASETDIEKSAVEEFLEQEELNILSIAYVDGKLQFEHHVSNADVCLLFYKIPHANDAKSQQGEQPQQQLGMLTLQGGMVKSMYNSLARVFSPKAGTRTSEYSSELSSLLENLHTSLGSTLGLPQNGISSIKDEIKYWSYKLTQKTSSRVEREMSQHFIKLLETIDKQMSVMEENIEEFLDQAHNYLDELWRLPFKYPQARMVDILDLIGNRLLQVCLESLLTEDIWNYASFNVSNLISQCIDSIESWTQLCDSLTRLFWPNYVQHAWLGDAYAPKRAQLFKERLLEIKNIKNLFKQISTLLNDEEVRDMFTAASPFKELNVFDISVFGQTKWNKALQYFEQMLQPIDERIALALRAQLHNQLSNARQVIFIFCKYETLIQRPTVLELLTMEREQFVQSLQVLLQDLRKAMSDTNMEPDTGHLSVICNECRWLKVVQHEIYEIEKVSHLISGRDGYDKTIKAVQEIKEEAESLLRTNFEIWCGQCSNDVKTGELRLREDQPVVKFEKEGRQLMRVTFNPKLVTFCQDVREFGYLGFNVPAELRAAANHASKFISYARRLQQISTFHNTIGDRMIPCQRPIMLKNAVELSKLVQSQIVAWNDEESVQKYVNTLQMAVSKLSNDNTLLVGYHEQAKRTVVKLMNMDLFTQSQMWKDEMRHMRELVATLERQGYNNLDAFKLHWDHQLYKVLEYQYIVGLVDMNNKLPDIHVDILFRQRQICFKPPEEEIRERYFTQLRRFIERPSGLRGLSDKSPELFKTMVENNRHHFGVLFRKGEELFERLAEFKKLWLPWIALGCVDAEELCNIHLHKAEDWDRNFRACKTFSQKIAKLQNNEQSIDCIVINLLPLRTDIEFISRRYWEALSNSLRASIINDISLIQEFLQNSFKFLHDMPMDEGSLTESSLKYEKMISELPKVQETLNLVKAKDTCLAGWCKERVSALGNILMQWEKLQPLLENHADVLQRQVNMIKEQANTQMQNLLNEAEKFYVRWESTIKELECNESSSLDLFRERQNHWEQIQSKKQHLLDECAKFNMSFSEQQLQPFQQMDEQIILQATPWQVYNSYLNELAEVTNEEWTIYRKRPYMLSELLTKWDSSVHASIDLPSKRIRQHVERLQNVLPVLQQLQSDALTERHWSRIFMLLNLQPKAMHNILVADILADLNALQHAASEISNISKQAASEQIVRQALIELDQWSVTATFKLITHNSHSAEPLSLVKDYQEVLNKIGDNQSLLQSAKNSAAFDNFSDQAELWENRLNSLDLLLTSLSHSQRRWIYLEPVFAAGTLKNEEALFKRIDKDFRYVLREIQSDARVVSILKINNINNIVNSLETQLARCQNNLVSYIMDKRNSFPRFYFLGDDDLLEILGQAGKDPQILQKHIKKLFPGCHKLGFSETIASSEQTSYYSITQLLSADGDILKFDHPILMTGDIELGLNNLLSNIESTLQQQMLACCQATSSSKQFDEPVLQLYTIQVLCTVRAIQFTKQVEKALSSLSLGQLQQQLQSEITRYATLKQQSAHALLQAKLRALLLDLVHYVTVVQLLIKENVMQCTDWHWLSQLRYYMQNERICIRMVYAEFAYSYEFLGNPNKLVSTSLTHKCYLILMQAMHMGLGGNPFGPAGTGKTECVKALGALLGRLVLVFNCDENVDAESMGLILTGLARCGAWGCFDEFNRLQEATLSAISMYIQPIQSALRDKSDLVQIGERQIKLNQHCGIFVTLNPAGIEYGGRQQLPGNIKALFRPIVMQQPEPREIARVLLFVEGFQQADEISKRLVEFFTLCDKMLSGQRHYDWGLRELKSVLLSCGLALQNENSANELSLVAGCLRSATISKLTQNDVARFDMLLASVFPEMQISTHANQPLANALSAAFDALSLCSNSRQIAKALQLSEKLKQRMGVVVVGPAGCGKSSVIALLRQAFISEGVQLRVHNISPKSMSRVHLLGQLNADTRQWQDGVLTHTAVLVNAELSKVHSWIICDGSIDPEWIEALNSVLDDNKLLTLPSGWRIQFGDNVNFIFETDDLRHASPATISRMGIVNLSDEDFPQEQLLQQQLGKLEFGDLLRSYIEEHFEPAAKWLQQQYLHLIPTLNKTSLMHALLLQLCAGAVQSRDEFCMIACQALYGFLPAEQHNQLANMICDKANIYLAKPNLAELTYYDATRSSIEYYEPGDLNAQQNLKLIFTANVQRQLAALNVLLQAATSTCFMLVGATGAAKTLMLQQAVQQLDGYDLIIINCSTQLTPMYVTHCLKQACVTVSSLRGREFKAKQTRLILYLRNLHLCQLDAWGNSDIVELLLQLVQRQGFHAQNLEWIHVANLQICASISTGTNTMSADEIAANAETAALLKIAPRYLALNQFVRVPAPSHADMCIVIQTRLERLLERRFQKSAPNVPYIVEGLMEFFHKLQNNYTTAAQGYAHYQFSSKLLMKIFNDLVYYPDQEFNEALRFELNATFRERLATEADVETYETLLKQTLRKLYGKEKIYFVPKVAKHNAELSALQHDDWLEDMHKQVTICNAESFVIEAPVMRELLDLTVHVMRVLSRAETHLLIIAQAGARHLDAVYIAATKQQGKLLLPQGCANYALLDFYSDLKLAMQTAALDNQCTCFLIEQCWLSYAADIMKPIEALLEGSEILDLFGDDLESIASALKHDAQLEGFPDSMSAYFMKRAKQNLHLIICLDASSTQVNTLLNKYPALYRNMELLYVRPASYETLVQLPKAYITSLAERNKQIVPVCSHFADLLDDFVAEQPPQRYYQLIASYFHIYNNFYAHIQQRLQKLQQGVDKLAAAHALVDTLKRDALLQEEALAEKRKLANDALDMISNTMHNANEQKSSMLELKQQTQVSSEQLKQRQQEIAEELSEVEPILREASAAVGSIKSEALSEIRSLRAPPEAIRDILEGVLLLMGIRDTSWNSMKTFLAKRGVKEDIRSLDPARISVENCQAVDKLLAAKADSFEMRNAKRASAAAAPLAAWVKASVRYAKVIQSIKPLEREQQELQRNLNMAEHELESLKSGLDDVDNRVKQLSLKLNAYTQEAAMLELKLQEARDTLNAAEVLVQKLSAEFHTWSQQLEDYKKSYKTLDTKSLLISFTINYLAHLTLDQRAEIMRRLSSDLQLPNMFNLRENLLTEQEQIIWESMGLACDAQIVEEAAILRKMLQLPFGSYPIPLLLDPTQTALQWLEEHLRAQGTACEFTTQNNERLSYTLELAVRFGKVLVVQDCQQLRPPLLQLLMQRVHVKFNKRQLSVGGKMIDLHEHFQLVLCSKTPMLNIAAESCAHLNIMPFTVTAVGLTDQLLSQAIVLKNPQLEAQRVELLKQEGVLLKQRIDLEDKLLEELSAAQGDILKNTHLLQTLNEVKESSSQIDSSLQQSASVKATLLADFTPLRALCNKAANFYVTLTAVYELSVVIYTQLFLSALADFDAIQTRDGNANILKQLVRYTFQYLARATTRSKHLSLALYICRHAYPERLPDIEWEMFLSNFMSSSEGAEKLLPAFLPEQLSQENKHKLHMLLSRLPELETELQLHKQSIWRTFLADNTLSDLPVQVKSAFQRVLIVQILRPDLITKQLKCTVAEILGINLDALQQPSLEQLANESSAEKPILLISQAECDPAAEIRSVARRRTQLSYVEISIGHGMEQRALQTIRSAAETGKWVCIKNVHLVPTWLTVLERELAAMRKMPEFRLWLVCESTQGFNEAIMYKFVKVLYELPSGLKQKVQRLIQNYITALAADQRLATPRGEARLLKMRIVCFILIAVLQTRRQYIPQAWSRYYEFGDVDLRAALEILLWLDAALASGRCDWTLMQRLCEHVAFGGRIQNMRDMRVLQCYLQQFCQAEVLSNRWTPLDMELVIPTSAHIDDYLTAIAKFSDHDEPELFKLTRQASANRDIELSKQIIRHLRAAHYKTAEDRLDECNYEKQIRPLLQLWHKIASNCNVLQSVAEILQLPANTAPWPLFVLAELQIAANCFKCVQQTLGLVSNWLKETHGKSNYKPEDLDTGLLQNLSENQTPLSWQRLWSGPLTVVEYLKALEVRTQAAEERFHNHLQSEFTKVIDFSKIFNCLTFLNCLKLLNARELQISSKDLQLSAQLLSNNAQQQISHDNKLYGVTLAPLKIDGAVFSAGKLVISSASDVRKTELVSPSFHITFKPIAADKIVGKTGNFMLPLYANAAREQLICELDVPTSETAETVLLSGAALIVADF